VLPVFGTLFTNEPVPANGKLRVGDAPGFGMDIADRSMLTIFE
jgi:L-rhamnonate dehydratase